jgi:hypothetical protein
MALLLVTPLSATNTATPQLFPSLIIIIMMLLLLSFTVRMEHQLDPQVVSLAEYWQNRADYVLTAKLNEGKNEIVGTDIITYTNNSPDQMNFVWMNVDQNLFKDDSMVTQ